MDIERETIEKAVCEGLYPEDMDTFPYEMLVEYRTQTSETKMMWAQVESVTDKVMAVLDAAAENDREVNAYEVDGHWVVSEGGVWLMGSYDTKATARLAADFSDTVLGDVHYICVEGEGGLNRPITLADLNEAAERLGEATR